MPRLLSLLLLVALSATSAQAAPASQPATPVVALQVLRQECFSCHNDDKKKGGLELTSRNAVLKGGDSGPAVVLGKPSDSLLLQSLTADADPHMPPKKQLPQDAIAALADWVKHDAPWDDRLLTDSADAKPIVFQSLPATYAPVLALALSPNGKSLAVGRGNQVHLYDVSGNEPTQKVTYAGPRDAVQSLAWSADNRRLAAGDYGRVLVWDAQKPDDSPVVLEGLSGRVTALLFLPKEDVLVVADGGAGASARLHRFELPNRQPAISVEAHSDTILSIACDKAGTLLATGGGDRTVRLWEPATLKAVATLEGHTGRISSIAFSPDGKQLVSGSSDRDMKTWDVKTRERKLSTGPHPAPITAVAWVSEKSIAVACEDGSLRANPSGNKDLARPFAANADDVIYAITASADGKSVFGGCHDGQVYLWGLNGKLQSKLTPASGSPASRPAK